MLTDVELFTSHVPMAAGEASRLDSICQHFAAFVQDRHIPVEMGDGMGGRFALPEL